jgi:hypothetical protein
MSRRDCLICFLISGVHLAQRTATHPHELMQDRGSRMPRRLQCTPTIPNWVHSATHVPTVLKCTTQETQVWC